MSNALMTVNDVQLGTIVVLALSLIAAAFIGCMIARCIAVSIRQVVKANRSIEDGDQNVTVALDRNS